MKQLPNSLDKKGFTLVELLVVIAIIAILSVIGITVFSNTQKNARDARRKADVDAIANALESNKTPASTKYSVLATTQFASGVIPDDTGNGSAEYSAASGATMPGDPTVWATTDASPTAPVGYAKVDTSVPGAVETWKVCARLENGGGNVTLTGATTADVYCKASAQ